MTCCNFAIVTCRKTGQLCSYRDQMEECPMAKVDTSSHITFKQCIEIYSEHASACELRKAQVKNTVLSSLAAIGFNESTSVDLMSYRQFKRLITALEEKRINGRNMAKITIRGILSCFAAITSESLRDHFEDLGYARPIFDIPKIVVPKKKVKTMTVEQDCQVEDWMRRLSVSTDRIEQRMFVALWFERLFGVRPGDINRLTWDCIQIDGSTVKLVYKPHKTEKYEGRDDPIVVPMKLWSWVAPFYVKGGLLLPRLRSARIAVSRNRIIWDRINDWYRAHGICDDIAYGKASYINRRQRITEAFEKDGLRGAAAIGKNTPKVQMEHYIAVGEYVA